MQILKRTSFLSSALLGLTIAGCSENAPPLGAAQATSSAPAVSVPRTGEQVYRDACVACHASGIAGAPKFADREGWHKLFDEGQAVVTAHGWVGVRGMPARGGQRDLTMEEFASAVAFMARSAGGDWQDPDAAMLDQIRQEEADRREALKKRAGSN